LSENIQKDSLDISKEEMRQELEDYASQQMEPEEDIIHDHFRPIMWKDNWQAFWKEFDSRPEVDQIIADISPEDESKVVDILSLDTNFNDAHTIQLKWIFDTPDERLEDLYDEKESFYEAWWYDNGNQYVTIAGPPDRFSDLTTEGLSRLYSAYINSLGTQKGKWYEKLYEQCQELEETYPEAPIPEECDQRICQMGQSCQIQNEKPCICRMDNGVEACTTQSYCFRQDGCGTIDLSNSQEC
ncbi:MAG: hypothetical protein ACQESG_02840, partial [Nanobdellota archaeon]